MADAPLKFTHSPQYESERLLPEPLPADPLPILDSWLREAADSGLFQNPNAMTLATVDPDGRPAARIVLCKEFDAANGRVVFFTNRQSRKGAALNSRPVASVVFFWDALNLQARVEGPVTDATAAESDEYWRTRWILSRLGAWASDQSRPVATRAEMLARVAEAGKRFSVPTDGSRDGDIPRPPHWGGYHLWAERVELWIGQPGRIHDRAEWTRPLVLRPSDKVAEGDRYEAGPWEARRLQP